MKPFRISEYLKKYQNIIIALSLVSGILCFLFVQVFVQKYQAKTIISYNYDGASQEVAPDGTALDISEIYSSNIITEVMDNLNVDKSTLNMDEIRGAISVEPLYTEEELSLEAAKLEDGEDYKKKTNKYLITYSSGIFSGKEFPRKILNEIIDVYSKWFAENHINNTSGAKDIKGILDKNYDYFEMLETIEDSIESNVNVLYEKNTFDGSFRSYKTGYTFIDIVNKLNIIKDNEVPAISAKILDESITKNKLVMISKYQAKNTALDTHNKAITEELSYLETAKDTYVDLMDDSGNTSITSEYILKELNTDYNEDKANLENSEYYVEYDRIMQSYVNNRYNFEKNLIDKDYNNYLIGRFQNSAVPDVNENSEKAIETETAIRTIIDRVDNMYTILSESNDEFNEYLGAKYVNNLSSTSVTEKVPVAWLTLGIVVVFGILGCGICIIIGRITDIVDYYAYTDHIDGLPNRAKLDRFLEEKGRKSLIDDYACINFKLVNLHEINMSLGRTKGDELIKGFAKVLTNVFEPSEKVFVSNNGPGYYCVFAEGYTSREITEMLARFRRDLSVEDSKKDYKTEYLQGFAVARDEKCYDVKELMLNARRKLQASAPVKERTASSQISGFNQNSSDQRAQQMQNTGRIPNVRTSGETGRMPSLRPDADQEEAYGNEERRNSNREYEVSLISGMNNRPERQRPERSEESRSARYNTGDISDPEETISGMNRQNRTSQQTSEQTEAYVHVQKTNGNTGILMFSQETRNDGNGNGSYRAPASTETDVFELNADYLSRYKNKNRNGR